MHTRRTFLGKTATASLGLGIGGGLVMPQAHGGIVLAQSVPDDENLEQLNRDLERVTRQIAQDGLNQDRYQQVTSYMRLYATDARENDRDAGLLEGVRAALDHPQGGRPTFIDQMLARHEEINAKAREMGIEQAVADPIPNPDGRLTQFLNGDIKYSTAYDDLANALDNLYPTIRERLVAGIGPRDPVFAGDACGLLQDDDGDNESFCATFQELREVQGILTGIICSLSGLASFLSLGVLLAIAVGACTGGAIGAAALWLINYWSC